MSLVDPSKVQFATGPATYGQALETPFRRFIQVAQRIEELGYAGIHTVDHMFLRPDRMLARSVDLQRPYQAEAFTTLAALAAVTSRVYLGPMVTPLSLRHPSLIAKMGAQIDVISHGRLILGCGTGWGEAEHVSFGLPYQPKFSVRYEQLLEGVQLIKKLWTEDGWVSFQGKHFRLQDAPLWPKPIQKPHPPIWFGGMGPRIRRAVAQVGDGWCPAAPHYEGLPPEHYREMLAEIRTLAKEEYRRDSNAIVPGMFCYIAIASTSQEALQKARIVQQRIDWKDTPLE
ncbi:MAG: LLM class flavin-dependent oxidoreductase, partial [Dehalococcoidia bacterium]